MARTSFQNVPDELRPLFNKALEQRDRFGLGVVQGAKRLLSDRERKLLSRKAIVNSPMEGRGSLFKYLAPFWWQLSAPQRETWKEAGAISGLSGWQLFISDNAVRIRNSMALPVPPSLLWQVRAGHLKIESPASELILKQDHPLEYWVLQKRRGQPWKSDPVLLKEQFSLPLQIAIRYKSNLIPATGEKKARYFARVWTSYQGKNTETDIEIPFAVSTDWTLAQASTAGLRGILISYTLFLEIKGYTGEVLFDNIRAVHTGTNWARDPRCDEINKKFKNAFAMVPPFWVPVSLPEGSSFASQYPPLL